MARRRAVDAARAPVEQRDESQPRGAADDHGPTVACGADRNPVIAPNPVRYGIHGKARDEVRELSLARSTGTAGQ
jgi:hypothetical protein